MRLLCTLLTSFFPFFLFFYLSILCLTTTANGGRLRQAFLPLFLSLSFPKSKGHRRRRRPTFDHRASLTNHLTNVQMIDFDQSPYLFSLLFPHSSFTIKKSLSTSQLAAVWLRVSPFATSQTRALAREWAIFERNWIERERERENCCQLTIANAGSSRQINQTNPIYAYYTSFFLSEVSIGFGIDFWCWRRCGGGGFLWWPGGIFLSLPS